MFCGYANFVIVCVKVKFNVKPGQWEFIKTFIDSTVHAY